MPFSEVIDTRSTISAPVARQVPMLHDDEKLPEFTEFKLENFKLASASAPHRLREARRSLVLFLEPNPDTPIHSSLETFQEKTFVRFGPNQAHNNPAHISLMGRILIERGLDFTTKWKTVDEFSAVIEEEVGRVRLSPPDFCGFDLLDKPTKSLIIKVRLNSDYNKLAKAIEKRMKPKCSALEVRSMDKMDLAYNVLQSLSKTTLKKIKEDAEATIDIYDWVKTGGSWRISLYEVMVESQMVGVRQQLTLLKSWPIQPVAQSVSSYLLPVSLRIKLSFLSSWFKLEPPPPPPQNKVEKSTESTAVVLRKKSKLFR
jgi:hypothetical protein